MEIAELYKVFLSHPVVTTDSRECPPGSMFFALKGDSFDGNKFAATALGKGCACAVVDKAEFMMPGDRRYILVDDCLEALQSLANYHRRALGTKIIGITGTNGKTTTKELMSAVLSKKFNVLYTLGNFNNDIGVPKTLLRLTKKHDLAVIEMGASHPGDIKALVEIVEPDFGLITNVGRAHLQGFGSFEGVVKTKGELYDYLRERADSIVFIHNEDDHLMSIAYDLNLIKYGTTDKAGLSICGSVTSCDPFVNIRWRHGSGSWHETRTQLIGSYNVYNMLAAACVGSYFDVSENDIDTALANYTPSNNRSQLLDTGRNKLVMDAYNANPTSMNAALTNFKDMRVSPKMAILGDMRELGKVSGEEHQKVVDTLAALGLSDVWLVGVEFGKTKCALRKFNNVDEVKLEIGEHPVNGYYILVKGSNGIRLASLSEVL